MSWMFAKISEKRGQSLVEMALVLPFLVGLALGVFDLSRAIRANNIIINMSREGASLALRMRPTISSEEIMNSLASTAQPLIIAQDGMMFITEVRRDNSGNLKISSQEGWSRNSNGSASRIDEGNIGGKLGQIPVAAGQSVYIFEVGYNYRSLFFPSYCPQLYSSTVF